MPSIDSCRLGPAISMNINSGKTSEKTKKRVLRNVRSTS